MEEKTELDILLGKSIEKIFIEDTSIEFVTNEGIYRFTLESECCSDSFISDIQGFDRIKGKRIMDIEKIELNDDGRNKRQEVDEIYGYRVKTRDEICDKTGLKISNNMIFAFRNSSNGYYGGNFRYKYTYPGEYEYGTKVDKVTNRIEIFDNYISE